MSTNPIFATITTSNISNISVNGSDRNSTTTNITVVVVGINIQFIATNYCCSKYY